MQALRLFSLIALVLAPCCHPIIVGAAAASGGGGGGGGNEDVVAIAAPSVDGTWAQPASSLTVTVSLGGTGGRARMLDFYLDPDGVQGSEPAIKLTPSPLVEVAGTDVTRVIPLSAIAMLPFDSYRLVAEVSNGMATATAQSVCPIYVQPADSQPATTVWTGTRRSTGKVDCRGLAPLTGGDVVLVGDWFGTVTTPLGTASTSEGGSFYLGRLQETDGGVVAEHFAMPLPGGFAEVRGVAVLPDDSCVLAGDFQGSMDFGTDETTNTPRIVTAARSSAFAAHYVFAGSQVLVRNVAVFGSAATVTGRGIATLPGSDEMVMVGGFSGLAQFGTFPPTAQGDSDGFVMRLRADLSVDWVARIGGPVADGEECVAVATNRIVPSQAVEIAVAGYVRGAVEVGAGNGDPPLQRTTTNGSRDAFAASYRPDGSVEWAHRWGGPGNDEGQAIALTSTSGGVVFLGGSFSGTVNYIATNPNNVTMARSLVSLAEGAGTNGCVVQYDGGGVLRWVSGLRSVASASVRAVAFLGPSAFPSTSIEELLVAGEFAGSLETLQPGDLGIGRARSMGEADAFLANLSTLPNDEGRVRRLRGFGGTGIDQATTLLVSDAPTQTYYLGASVGSESVLCPPLAGFAPGANLTSCAVVRLAHQN